MNPVNNMAKPDKVAKVHNLKTNLLTEFKKEMLIIIIIIITWKSCFTISLFGSTCDNLKTPEDTALRHVSLAF